MFGSKNSRNVFLCVFFLSGLGLVQVYSSSFLFAEEKYGWGLFFLKKQLIFTLLGWGLFFIFASTPWRHNRWLGTALWFLSSLALIFTLFPQTGIAVGGSTRWLNLPQGFTFQPSELLKVSTPFLLSWLVILKEKWPLQEVFFWAVSLLAFGFPLLILSLQPDLGTVVLLTSLVFALSFVVGVNWIYFSSALAITGGGFCYLILSQAYRSARMDAFLNPWEDPLGKGFQIIQSLLGIHSGGLFGTGLGKGQIKLFFLPEAHTDFTLAVLAEETGFAGLSALFSVYAFLIYSGFQISLKIHDFYEKILSFGLVFIFAINVFIHSAVNLSLLPAKGLTLPFLSYGGSSLVCSFMLFGWLLSIERNNRINI